MICYQKQEKLEFKSNNTIAGIDIRNIFCTHIFNCETKDFTHIFLPKTKDSFMMLKDFKKYKISNRDNIYDLMISHNNN